MILDASVIAKWFLEEEGTEKSLRIRDKYFKGEIDIVVPDLLIYEVLNVLRYRDFNEEEIDKAMNSLFSMDIFFVDPSKRGMSSTTKIALEEDLTIYDATYVSLSDQFETKLITADKELHNKTKEAHNVQNLQKLKLEKI